MTDNYQRLESKDQLMVWTQACLLVDGNYTTATKEEMAEKIATKLLEESLSPSI